MAQAFDAIVIGGGINGCSTALELSRQGLRVALMEKDTIGAGPTGKSSAIIRQHYSNEITARMALYSLRVFQDFAEAVGGESGYTASGYLAIVVARDQHSMEANIAMHRRVGIKTELISAAATRDLFPGIVTDDFVAAAYEPEGGYADPYSTVNAYADACKRSGVQVMVETEVTGVRFAGGKAAGVDTRRGPFDAPVVVNCAGPWGARVAKMAGVEGIPINACRSQVTFFKRPKGHEASHPVLSDFNNGSYFRAETGGITAVGLIDPEEANHIVDPDKVSEAVSPEFVMITGERFIQRYPAMEAAEVRGGYASLYDITPDWHPIIDEVPHGSGFYICAGFSGHGFKLGPAVGRLTADLVTKVTDPLFSAHAFRLSRYEENEPIRGQYEYSIIG